MSVQTPALDVTGYADAVRRALAGLGPDQVDDLTDGLEADLAEARADDRHAGHGATLLEQFGPPEQYAADLRAAAGLEPGPDERQRRRPHPVRRTRELATSGLARLRATTWWPAVEGLVVSLRPAWWLVRGWVLYQLVTGLAGPVALRPHTFARWLLLLALLVLSVQWGRGRLRLPGRWDSLGMVVSALAAVALLPLLGSVQSARGGYVATAVAVQQVPADGVVVDGMAVSNLFVYDAAGDPVPSAQVYDDRGRPVRTTQDEGGVPYWYSGSKEPWYLVGAQDAYGRTLWNVYPLQGGPISAFEANDGGLKPVPGVTLATPPWPFAKAPAVSTATATSPAASPMASQADPGASAPAATAPGGAATSAP